MQSRGGSLMASAGKLALTDAAKVERQIEEYFQSRMRKRYIPVGKVDGEMIYEAEEYMAPPTMAGLALALGVTRTTILHYSKGEGNRDESLIPIIARAKGRIAEWWEEALATREASTGAQFALRVNHRYGVEDEGGGTGDGFQVQVIPPASSEDLQAIPKWQPKGDSDE